MNNQRTFPIVIPAAGIGSRMAAPTAKQYLRLGDKTILEHTIDLFLQHNSIDKIVVVLHPEDTIFASLAISEHEQVHAVTGGSERVDSVLAGLEYVRGVTNSEWVLVHDAARPCLQPVDLNRLIEQSILATGGILAVPVADTIKKAKADSTSIESTVDRSTLWQAQTPQMFPTATLIKAIEKALNAKALITDEASAMEFSGHKVLLIEGQSSNIKITRPADLALAEYYLTLNTCSQDT